MLKLDFFQRIFFNPQVNLLVKVKDSYLNYLIACYILFKITKVINKQKIWK